jgi:hypothetical protein
MRFLTTLTLLIIATNLSANILYIDITKISADSKLVDAYNIIKENKQYYDHWSMNWDYVKSKSDLIALLRGHYQNFAALNSKNVETYLLLGDIAHYLYNMDDREFYDSAVANYGKAEKINSDDYRIHWFRGGHYAASNNQAKGIVNYLRAEKLLPAKPPADFWNDYAWATAVANMPSHCIYAMDMVKSITKKKGSFEEKLGETIYKRIVPVEKNQDYKKEDIWTAAQGERVAFTSRPLGIKILVDTTWDIGIYDYQKNQEAVVMKPQRITSKKGREIGFSMAIFMKTAEKKDKIEDFIAQFLPGKLEKKKIIFSDKYNDIVAYEAIDKSLYPEIGGGRIYMISFERKSPRYPGLLLENPVSTPKGKPEELSFYELGESKSRFEGRIFYALMLDTCGDIQEESFAFFKDYFENGISIE